MLLLCVILRIMLKISLTRLRNRTVRNHTGEKLLHQMPALDLVKQPWGSLILKLEGKNITINGSKLWEWICSLMDTCRFIKSYRKFGDPCSRLQEIAADASLNCKQSQLKKLAQTLHANCVEAEQKSLKIAQSTVNGNGRSPHS